MDQVLAFVVRYWPVIVVPVLLPLLIQYEMSCSWKSGWKLAYALFVSAAFGAVAAVIALGMPSAATIAAWAAVMMVSTQATFRLFKIVAPAWLDALLALGSTPKA